MEVEGKTRSRNRRERNESSLRRGELLNVARRLKLPRCPLHLAWGGYFPMGTWYLLPTRPLVRKPLGTVVVGETGVVVLLPRGQVH